MAANLKEVRERIKSVNSTQQITKAMKMVAASKLRRAQQAITDIRPYADRLNTVLRNILSNMEGDASSSFGKARPVQRVMVVVVTSSRGLCGAFNTNVIKEAVKLIDKDYSEVREQGKLSIMCIGKKGWDYFSKKYAECNVINDHVNLFGDLSFDQVAPVADALMDAFISEDYDMIDVVYGEFKNPAVQNPMAKQYLPVKKVIRADDNESKLRADYIFEPSKEELLESLVPSILQIQFHKFLLDTHASEHGARMTAMDKATENAEEMLRELKINYNKARQEAITRELSEIVGGAAALEG